MAEIVVAAESRTESGKNKNRRLRESGKIPGILYGAKKETIAVSVSPREITAILRSASGENTLFDLDLQGTKRKVILKDFQVEPLKGHLLHADFYEIALDKVLEVKVHLELHGTPVGVKVEGGILDFVTRELEIECLPTHIPDKIRVDVSNLALGQNLRVSEIVVPPDVKVMTDPGIVVAHVVAPRAEEVVAAPEAVAAEGAVEPEVIKKGKTVEGEAAAEEKPEKPEKAERAEKKEKK
jgi:large subunit ribosomal protein L25